MGKMSLYMLKVFSDVPAALVIDSTVAAHTDKEGTAVTVSGSEMFVQIYALMGNYPPICRYIRAVYPLYSPPSAALGVSRHENR